MSNDDKHRRLTEINIPANKVSATNEALIDLIYAAAMKRLAKIPAVEVGTVLFSARVPKLAQSNVDVAGYVVPEVAIREGKPVLEVAYALINATLDCLNDLERQPIR